MTKIHIMGILNLTPDSFYAASRVQGTADLLQRAAKMWADGADTLDLGACSTRPGSRQPSLEEEWQRLEPALQALAEEGSSWGQRGREGLSSASLRDPVRANAPDSPSRPRWPRLSLDTYRSGIVERAYKILGPTFLVNDISAGGMDPEMLPAVKELVLPYIAMHMRGTPETMQQCTEYQDIIQEINDYFLAFSEKAAGIKDWILDPGFGFSKTREQNWELLERLDQVNPLGHPILVGLSRKSMMGTTPEEAMPATQLAQLRALQKGATWLRVHDVKPAVQTIQKYYSTI